MIEEGKPAPGSELATNPGRAGQVLGRTGEPVVLCFDPNNDPAQANTGRGFLRGRSPWRAWRRRAHARAASASRSLTCTSRHLRA